MTRIGQVVCNVAAEMRVTVTHPTDDVTTLSACRGGNQSILALTVSSSEGEPPRGHGAFTDVNNTSQRST